ncbi:MAG: pilus assembly protein TadG-related protein [Armatimonadota bacterium]
MKRRKTAARVLWQRNHGTTLVLVVVTLTVLIGAAAMTIDVGRLLVARDRAQMICDAGALAGGWYLTGEPSSTRVDSSSGGPTSGDGDAAKFAKYAAQANNEAAPNWIALNPVSHQPGVAVSFPPYPLHSGFVQTDSGASVPVRLGEAIKVEAIINVPMFFGALLGVHDVDVRAEATAIVSVTGPSPVVVTTSPLPWALADTNIWTSGSPPQVIVHMGDRASLKVTNPGDPEGFIGSGNFLAVAFPGDTGGNAYRDRIAGTTPPITFHLNDPVTLNSEPGNITGPTSQGLIERLTGDIYPYPSANDTAWSSWLASYDPITGQRADTKRIGLVPIVRDPGGDLHGRTSLELIGFAGIFIEGFETVTEGNNTYIRVVGRYTSGVYSANGITWLDPYVDPPYSSTVSSVRLVK